MDFVAVMENVDLRLAEHIVPELIELLLYTVKNCRPIINRLHIQKLFRFLYAHIIEHIFDFILRPEHLVPFVGIPLVIFSADFLQKLLVEPPQRIGHIPALLGKSRVCRNAHIKQLRCKRIVVQIHVCAVLYADRLTEVCGKHCIRFKKFLSVIVSVIPKLNGKPDFVFPGKRIFHFIQFNGSLQFFSAAVPGVYLDTVIVFILAHLNLLLFLLVLSFDIFCRNLA